MANEKSLKNLKPAWKKGDPSPNAKGRPRKVFTDLAKKYQAEGYPPVKARDIAEAYEVLIGLPQDKLIEIMKDESQPILFKIVIKSLVGNRGLEAIETMLDRVHGKPKQVNELSGAVDSNVVINIIRPSKK
jgi:hypothetical protein